ncbi:RING-H2 finger protein ATL52-like [Silene latifolia]|uniref:RING-H2 finger protein ATL52-like n=1 Tax=Silene latifolia TaxID=37657 RepID=UPI003D7779C4
MVMELVVSLILLFVGIAVLVTIHMCIVGRAFSRGFGSDGFLQRGSIPITKGIGMNLQDLKKLRCFEYEDSGEKGDGPKDCAVCLDNFKCVDMWLMKAPFCPLCRANAKSSSKIREPVKDEQGSTPSVVVDDLL